MKIAIISDIHGNLPALEAVLEMIDKRGVDKIICLGDIVGKGPSTNEVIDICKKECEIVIIGNWECGIYNKYKEYKEGQLIEHKHTRWCIENIKTSDMEYLGALPHSTEFYFGGKLARLFHANPAGFKRYFVSDSIEKKLELFEPSEHSKEKRKADIAIYGDIHNAYVQTIESKHLINVGSAGLPYHTTNATFVMLEEYDENNYSMQIMQIPYDRERAIELAKKANIPDLNEYICELKTGKYFRRE